MLGESQRRENPFICRMIYVTSKAPSGKDLVPSEPQGQPANKHRAVQPLSLLPRPAPHLHKHLSHVDDAKRLFRRCLIFAEYSHLLGRDSIALDRILLSKEAVHVADEGARDGGR